MAIGIILSIISTHIFCGKYRRNSIDNDYCSSKQGFVVGRLRLVGSVGLGLGLVRSLGLRLRVRVSASIIGSGEKPGLPPQQSFSMLLWRYLPLQKSGAFLKPRCFTNDISPSVHSDSSCYLYMRYRPICAIDRSRCAFDGSADST